MWDAVAVSQLSVIEGGYSTGNGGNGGKGGIGPNGKGKDSQD